MLKGPVRYRYTNVNFSNVTVTFQNGTKVSQEPGGAHPLNVNTLKSGHFGVLPPEIRTLGVLPPEIKTLWCFTPEIRTLWCFAP